MKALEAGSYRIVPGEHYGTPKEVWGFRSSRGEGTPLAIARAFLRANEDLLGLRGIRGRLKAAVTLRSLGAAHVILQQHHGGARVHRAYVTVHVGRRDRRVYLVKNRAMPRDFLPEKVAAKLGRRQAIRRARRFLGVGKAHSRVLQVERLWFPDGDELVLSIKVRLDVRVHPDPREEWILYVDAQTGEVLSHYDNLAAARGKARVFDPNPVIALGDHRPLLDGDGEPLAPVPDEAYTDVVLRDLDGTGRLDGKRVTTKPTGRRRVRRADGDFRFSSDQRGFEEAMVYHHIDRAIRRLESLGYRGERAIFDGPLPVDVRGTEEDQSWYSPGRRMLFFGLGGGVNDAEDAETILHELGHALQDAICPDFGQSEQAAALGEGFGDYLALSSFPDRPAGYERCVMTWDGITWWWNDPPCVRKLDTGLTFESFDPENGEHDNGRIWAETLLEILAALGRRSADKLIVESHFQLDGFTTFARAARSILDADRNLYRGQHRRKLLGILRGRGIGPLE